MRVGAIDIGTNSMRLLIADVDNDKLYNREKYVNVTRIGKGVDKNGMISEKAIERNIKSLDDYVKIAKSKNCSKIKVIGTSALRDSKNKEEFVKRAEKITGVRVDIIDGDMEAKLGFFGVKNLVDRDSYTLIVDIGGGSTEFTMCDKDKNIVFSKSEDIGVVRLTERCIKSDPPCEKELIYLDSEIIKSLENTISYLKTYQIAKIIGIGGTFTSISSMIQELEPYSMEKVHKFVITYKSLIKQYEKLKSKTLEEKQMIKGLQPQRADVILAGVSIIKTFLKMIDFDKVIVSEYDNLEGLIYSIMM